MKNVALRRILFGRLLFLSDRPLIIFNWPKIISLQITQGYKIPLKSTIFDLKKMSLQKENTLLVSRI